MKNCQRKSFNFLVCIILLGCILTYANAATDSPEIGTVITGHIATVGQTNTYMTPCDTNESFYVKAVKTEGKLWPRITIYSPGGNEIQKKYDPSKAETVITITDHGSCSILVDDGTSWSYIGDYNLYIQSVTDPTLAVPLVIGSTQTGDISVPGKTDTYTFTGRSGQMIVLKASKSSGDLWPRITVYSPAGKSVATGYDPGKIELKYNISETGQYVILIDDGTSWNKVGGYTLFSQVFSNGNSEPGPVPLNEVYTLLGNSGNDQKEQFGESAPLQPAILAGILIIIVIVGIGILLWKKRRDSGKISSIGKGESRQSIQVPSSFEGKVSGTVNHDVIISYSTQDKPVADAVCAGLEARGIRCWIAPRDILPGVNYQEGIIDAITSSKIMVLIFSANSNDSPYVIREATIAVSKKVIIIPFRIDDSPLSKTMEFIISVPHWLDAVTPPLEKHIRELGDTIMILLENEKKKQKKE